MGQKPAEMIGLKFGMLTVLYEVQKDAHGHPRYMCECSCEDRNRVIRNGSLLRFRAARDQKLSCGCLNTPQAEDIVGKRFGKLVVVGKTDRMPQGRNTNINAYECTCDCGGSIDLARSSLVAPETRGFTRRTHCGCEDQPTFEPDPQLGQELVDNLYPRLKHLRPCAKQIFLLGIPPQDAVDSAMRNLYLSEASYGKEWHDGGLVKALNYAAMALKKEDYKPHPSFHSQLISLEVVRLVLADILAYERDEELSYLSEDAAETLHLWYEDLEPSLKTPLGIIEREENDLSDIESRRLAFALSKMRDRLSVSTEFDSIRSRALDKRKEIAKRFADS